jgi:hypothetical protein
MQAAKSMDPQLRLPEKGANQAGQQVWCSYAASSAAPRRRAGLQFGSQVRAGVVERHQASSSELGYVQAVPEFKQGSLP